ncbi:MAG TPA: NACHT domain-containing protein [Rhizomicrobium sp.]|nr:NACHT domain-containing protein [Rhizomicrobium sp.]
MNISSFHFDPLTSLVTLLVAPLFIYILGSLRKFFIGRAQYFLDGGFYWLSRAVTRRVAALWTLRHYCRLQLAGPTQHLNIPASRERNMKIDDIFVPVVFETGNASVSFRNENALESGTRLRIIGDPGSGKSSVAKRLFRDECRKAIGRDRRARLPILLELRKLSIPTGIVDEQLGDWLLAALKEDCARKETYDIATCFENYARGNGLLVVLDGLDEVPSPQYGRAETAINHLSRRLGELSENNIVILTMRVQFHQQVRASFSETFPTVLSLKRFTPTDIFEFLRRWPFSKDRQRSEVVRIFNDLTDRPALREMCTNPLVLAMYVARDEEVGGDLTPDSRTDFYSQVLDELLIRRRAKQVGPSEAQAILRQQRQQIFGHIAFLHLLDEAQALNLLPWALGVSAVMTVTGLDRPAAEQYLRELSKDTGLITEEREGETFRFIHLTFCEFLCAYEAVQGRKSGWLDLINAHKRFSADAISKPRLLEVLPFACALMPRHQKGDAVTQIVEFGDEHLSSLTFVETKAYDHDDWPEYVRSTRQKLLQAANRNDNWLRELHLFLVTVADAARAADLVRLPRQVDQVVDFFKELAGESQLELISLIGAYAQQDAAAAFRIAELCDIDVLRQAPQMIITNCDQPPFLAIALERSQTIDNDRAEWAQLFSEASLRSTAVAFALSELNDASWSKIARSAPVESRWFLKPVFPESILTDFLTITCAAKIDKTDTPVVVEFVKIVSPNRGAIRRFFLRYAGEAFYIYALVGYLPMIFLVFSDDVFPGYQNWRPVLAKVAVLSLMLLFVGMMFTLRQGWIIASYQQVVRTYAIGNSRGEGRVFYLRVMLPLVLAMGGKMHPLSRLVWSDLLDEKSRLRRLMLGADFVAQLSRFESARASCSPRALS